MLDTIPTSLQLLLTVLGNIPLNEVDISFDLPSKEWSTTLARPTINFFLYDIKENVDLRTSDLRGARANGRKEFRLPSRRFDLRYMVSVLASDPRDEHEILWRVMATLLKYPEYPAEILPEELRKLEPPITAGLSDQESGRDLLDLWDGLGMPPRPALVYIVTVPLDLEVVIQSPLVLTRTIRHQNLLNGASFGTASLIGGIVRDKAGQPIQGVTVKLENSALDGVTTNKEGQFRLPRVPDGAVMLQLLRDGVLQKRVEVSVPAESYDLLLE